MPISRRDFLKATAAVAGALGISSPLLQREQEALAKEGGLQVVWLQGQACTGCSVSLLNSIYYATIDDLLLNTLDLQYHPNVMAGAGSTAIAAAEEAYAKGGFALVIEGAIPTAYGGRACYVWPGTTMQAAVTRYAAKAAAIIAVGTCASFGGMAAGRPNPTQARPVKTIVGSRPVINIPGCPAHPDWIVGTIAYILQNGKVPPLDSYGRPTDFFGKTTHSACPRRSSYVGPGHHSRGRPCLACHTLAGSGGGRARGEEDDEAESLNASQIPAAALSMPGCLSPMGCKGVSTYCDCPTRMWNSGAAATPGVNWCIGAGSPCIGCTQPNFPDGMSPFLTAAATANPGAAPSGGGTGGGTGGGETDDD